MKAIFTLLILLPLASPAQKNVFLADVSTSFAGDVKASYGAMVTAGARIYPSGYLTLSCGAKKLEGFSGVLVPVTGGILYAPRNSSPISPIGRIDLGYSLYGSEGVNGWFYSSMAMGIKANSKWAPFVMLSLSRPELSTRDRFDHVHELPYWTGELHAGLVF